MNTALTPTLADPQVLTPVLAPGGSIEAYTHAVNQLPLLTAEQERSLALRLRDHGDVAAARELVLSHLRFVVRVARGYRGYGLQEADLIQEGNIGLMKAVKRFDPDVGVRLVSFAVHWIRAEMHEFILRNWRIVKVATTKAQRKLFFNLRSAKKRLGWLNREEVEAVAEDLGVTAHDVMEMESRMAAHDSSLEISGHDDEDDHHAPVSYLEDLRDGPEAALENSQMEMRDEGLLKTGLAGLDERSRDIIARRWLNESKATLHELAADYGISAERVRQLEQTALKKMRAALAA